MEEAQRALSARLDAARYWKEGYIAEATQNKSQKLHRDMLKMKATRVKALFDTERARNLSLQQLLDQKSQQNVQLLYTVRLSCLWIIAKTATVGQPIEMRVCEGRLLLTARPLKAKGSYETAPLLF